MVASRTSGPMPSPGSRRSLYSFIGEPVSLFFGRSGLAPTLLKPGRLAMLVFLEGGDLVLVAQGQADIVPAVHQHLLAEGVHFELDHAAIGAANFLRFQIDGDD